jgi:hypothetical protein
MTHFYHQQYLVPAIFLAFFLYPFPPGPTFLIPGADGDGTQRRGFNAPEASRTFVGSGGPFSFNMTYLASPELSV